MVNWQKSFGKLSNGTARSLKCFISIDTAIQLLSRILKIHSEVAEILMQRCSSQYYSLLHKKEKFKQF